MPLILNGIRKRLHHLFCHHVVLNCVISLSWVVKRTEETVSYEDQSYHAYVYVFFPILVNILFNFFAYSTELNNDAEAVSTGQGKTTDELEGCFTLKCPGSMASG